MKRIGPTRHWLGVSSLLLASLGASQARAEEPRKVTEPAVMRRPAEVTNVIDAFDDKDKFDLNLTLGFQQTWTNGTINRETHSDLPQYSSGGYTAGNLKVAKYSEKTSRLNTRADIGLYKDIALFFRLPVILSNTRTVSATHGSGNRQGLLLQGAPGEQLFRLPTRSPTRSGIEYLAVGLDLGLMNQARDYTKPTWVFGFEGRFSITEPMHACRKNTNAINGGIQPVLGPTGSNPPLGNNQQQCADESDINRNGKSGEYVDNNLSPPERLEGTNFQGGRNPGVSRGTTGLELHTYMSKRIKYVEPYGGFQAIFEFQNANSDFGKTNLTGALVNHPPFQGSLIAGVAVVPWEIRDKYQRVELDFRLKGTYRSEGRDYSPLFDALGSSDAPSLRRPNYAEFQRVDPADPNSGSRVNPRSQKVWNTGITDVQQHGIYTLTSQVTFQAGEYVKFNLGGGVTAIQGHVLTFDQPCNPDFSGDPGRSGPCRKTATSNVDTSTPLGNVTGIPNPNYRPTIDVPGRRFRLDDALTYNVWLNAIVMF